MKKFVAADFCPPTYKTNIAWGVTLALFGATLLLTRQAQFQSLQGVTVAWILLSLLLSRAYKLDSSIFLPILVYCSCSALVSLAAGYKLDDIARFFAILLATTLAFNVRSRKISVSLVLTPIVIQCLLISILSATLGLLRDPVLASAVRNMALENKWGDVYSFDGIYYRVQIIGNALIPLLFIICLLERNKRFFHKIGLLISAIGVVAAGNLTYILVAVLAVILKYRKELMRKWLALLLVALTVIPTVFFSEVVQETIQRKFDGPNSSMAVRFDQIATIAKSFGESPGIMLFGAGIGARFPNGKERNYSEFLYIELQTLYITYQIGFIGMIVYLLTIMRLTQRRLSVDGRRIFWLYILSGLSNPYIFDTNQVVVTMILMHLYPAQRSTALKFETQV